MKAIIICGATGTGKSDLAFSLAKKLNCEIINFDSVQVYEDLNIGSAKPPAEFTKEIKHHLLGQISPTRNFTAGDFRREALKVLAELSAKHKFVVVVGGTGFYLNALINGMYAVPAASPEIKDRLKVELKERGIERLYDELKLIDPSTARRLHLNDEYRILRALELIRSGFIPSQNLKPKSEDRFPYAYIKIGLKRDREELKKSITLRTEKMIQLGLLEETKNLIAKYGEEIRPLQSVGYAEAAGFLKKGLSLENSEDRKSLVEQITTSTMQLVKKQNTWFKRDQEIHWLDPDHGDVLAKTLELLDFKP